MATKKIYHGWIFMEKGDKHLKESFSTQRTKEGDESEVTFQGYGELGAVRAVDYFEKKLGLGHISLEKTPIGLRVFTLEEVNNTKKDT